MNSPKPTGSQVVTRSLSSAFTKITKTQTSSPIPLSVVDFQKTMAEFQKKKNKHLNNANYYHNYKVLNSMSLTKV